jgi:tetratricopeptide (TPR) repeat protein
LENYLILNPDYPDILSLLATFCIKTDRLDKAEEIYTKLMQKYPHESNFVYDLGIVAYMRADYEEALAHFKQAIAMDKNPDAYLYAGITLEMMGNKKEALKYYQDRVRYKTSDDDVYAREAMRGIRKILEEMDTLKDSLQ